MVTNPSNDRNMTMSNRSTPEPAKLPSGSWRLRYVAPNGKRYSITNKRKGAVIAQFEQEQKAIALDTWTPPNTRKNPKASTVPTIAEYFETLPTKRAWKQGTITGRRSQFTNDIAPAFGTVPLNKVTKAEIFDWYSSLLKNHPKRLKRNSETYSLLHLIFDEAIKDNHIETNPVDIPGANRKHTHTPAPLPSHEDIKAILNNAPHQYQVPIMFAIATALRIGEWSALNREDILISTNSNGTEIWHVYVHKQAQDAPGGGMTIVDTTKTGKPRWVTIPNQLIPVLRAHMDSMADQRPIAILFPNKDGGRIDRRRFNRSLNRLRQELGISARVTSHQLRHFGATEFTRNGGSMVEVMARLGHSTTSAALRYQHATQERDLEIANRMNLPTLL